MTSLLFVCTGNICRSPAAEALFRHRVDPAITVSSAGTAALLGYEIPDTMKSLIRHEGGDVEGFAPRQLTRTMIVGATVIITMTKAQRASVVRTVPTAVTRSFTLIELARLSQTISSAKLDGTPAEKLQLLPECAAAERPRHLEQAQVTDIPDPYRRRRSVYRKSFAMIEAAVDKLVQVIQ